MTFRPQDHYFKKAKSLHFNARSVFKLEEIDQKCKLTITAKTALDLGCAPGSWSQYLAKKLGADGRIVGLDLTEVKLNLPQVKTFVRDCFDADLSNFFRENALPEIFDLVLSDMAPKTTGIRLTDQARSTELCEKALEVAKTHLRPGGHFVCKFFHSDDFESLRDQMKKVFAKVDVLKPQSTRTMSKEIFLIGLRKR